MPDYFNGGLKVDEFGTVQTSAGPTNHYVQGIPVDVDGNVVVTTSRYPGNSMVDSITAPPCGLGDTHRA